MDIELGMNTGANPRPAKSRGVSIECRVEKERGRILAQVNCTANCFSVIRIVIQEIATNKCRPALGDGQLPRPYLGSWYIPRKKLSVQTPHFPHWKYWCCHSAKFR